MDHPINARGSVVPGRLFLTGLNPFTGGRGRLLAGLLRRLALPALLERLDRLGSYHPPGSGAAHGRIHGFKMTVVDKIANLLGGALQVLGGFGRRVCLAHLVSPC